MNRRQCPKCGCWSLERLRSYSHCWECGYFPESERINRLRDPMHDFIIEESRSVDLVLAHFTRNGIA